MAYTNKTVFETDLAAAGLTDTTLDFESQTAGDLIPSGSSAGGITFTYNFGGATILVDNLFETTSPTNYLGTDDAGLFLDGDDFDLSFAPVNAIGMFFITADFMFNGDIELTVNGVTASLATADVSFLPLGDQVYFLGLIDDMNTFTTASITTLGLGAFFYNVDDIVLASAAAGPMVPVPEPASAPLFLVGLIGLWAASRRWRPAQ